MHIVDLRSDTVTLPSPTMREAIATAELGDDVFGEDPTVNRLEAMAAERLGKEAAMLVMSGTMANLVSVLTHCGRGDEIIVGDKAHIFLDEAGGCSALGGVHSHQVPNQPDGTLALADIEAAVREDDIHFPRSKLICLENTHNMCGGVCLTPDYMHQVRQLADQYGLMIHLDGARIFNAAVALGVEVKELARDADSVSFCLSKGLAAPIGSLVCGSRDFIKAARRVRKVVGGGTRQAGIIAAAGIVALEQMVDRLAEDHANARLLADGLANMPGITLDLTRVQTNLVFFEVAGTLWTAAEFCERLAVLGVLMLPLGRYTVRAVTHYGIERADVEHALRTVSQLLKG
ncbi:MAG: low-specificity L-threonine aldolase [Ardenticatenia bacterium]|nr:MAG: low-specificity L-threonine aldolase [Ardenticatenia bacterium]